MAESAPPAEKPKIKHDWYQTETTVAITILVKNVTQDLLNVHFTPNKVTLDVKFDEPIHLEFDLLHEIVADECAYKLTPSKIELKLKKAEGIRWAKLEGEPPKILPKEIPVQTPQGDDKPPAYPTSKKGKDWNAVEKDLKAEEAKEKPEGEDALNKLFQEIYGKGSDEVKRAMNKSYMESGGTVLSTNWDEISKEEVKVKPPDGMEFKKW